MDDAGGKGVSDGAVRLTYVDDMGGIDDLDGVVYVCDVGDMGAPDDAVSNLAWLFDDGGSWL